MTYDPDFDDEPMGIIAGYHGAMAHSQAMRAANARTMEITAGDPPPDARELTLAEVAHGVFGDSAWQWPEPVLAAAVANTRDLGDDWADLACVAMRAIANLYAKGYRLTGPQVIAAVPGTPTDDEAAAYLAGRGLDPTGTTPTKHNGRLSVEKLACGRALREQWPALLIPDAQELVGRLATMTSTGGPP